MESRPRLEESSGSQAFLIMIPRLAGRQVKNSKKQNFKATMSLGKNWSTGEWRADDSKALLTPGRALMWHEYRVLWAAKLWFVAS